MSQKVRRIFIGLEKYVKEQTDAAAFRVLVGLPPPGDEQAQHAIAWDISGCQLGYGT
ncbi:hypothetical protein QSH35_015545 [Xanthomonas arboricola pv. juglandis]|uniref:hypothetical protein n=1 Tax=Xanthomonas arboricola TaxID=56448 RepID=UPI0025C95D84|nr:hypothetical protein [Xanthomonas arboricola pv. juglandis]